jgi:hypothetical protein
VRAALEWKDEALGAALYELRPDLVADIVASLDQPEAEVQTALLLEQPSESMENVIVRLANDLARGNADQRKRAVEELVAIKTARTSDALLRKTLDPAHMRLVEIFERARSGGGQQQP